MAQAATLYTNDGVLTGYLEAQRWHINRARFAPEREADRLGLVNTNAGGHPDYDVCEDTQGPNDFGTTTSQWAIWTAPRPPVAPNEQLRRATDKHSRDMAECRAFSHYSPSANYYPLNSTPWDRGVAEGYSYSSYAENIGAGFWTPSSLHDALFVDTSISNRGHRKNILSTSVREIGLGRAVTNTYYSTYDTHDFAGRSSVHFFTGTLFHDANTNGVYDTTEGVGGIEIRLWNGTNEAAWYDVSEASGNMAIPISDLTDGREIQVELRNTNTSARTLSLPLGYNTLGDLTLESGASQIIGAFLQPNGVTNVGFRNLTPVVAGGLAATEGGIHFSSPGLGRVAYRIEQTAQLLPPDWQEWATVTGRDSQISAPLTGDSTAQYYRVFLLAD